MYMRGFSLFRRAGLAVAIGAAMVTPTFANTMGGGFWNQIVFDGTSFDPNNPATSVSNFHNTGNWYTQTVQAYNNAAYTTSGFTAASEWVGSSTYQTGGWSIYYFDFVMASTSALEGIFSSDNTSFLMLDNFAPGIGSFGSGGSSSFTIDGDPAGGTSAGFLGYRPAVDPNDGNQNSFQGVASTFTTAVLAQGSSHRLWAIVRNDMVNPPSGNPNAFRLEFTSGGGGNTTPVPEPFTMALGAAGIGLAVRRRLKKSS